MELDALRREIDNIDKELIALFAKRMELCAKIGEYKKENGLPVYDKARENEKLARAADVSRDDLKPYTRILFEKLFELSRDYQESL